MRDAPRRGWSGATLVAVGAVVYLNSFQGVFLFDDEAFIVDNEKIRRLWPIWELLSETFGRQVVEVSLAINYAISGLNTWSYHALNLAVHLSAGLALMGIVRRTLLFDPLGKRYASSAGRLALSVALIWTVHPLLTESVTYVHQRAESMTGMFYLLSLYCVIRGVESRRRPWWYAASVIACALGMGCKAIMVTAPVLIGLYDRLFLSPSFLHAVRRRWALYLCLAATTLGTSGVVRHTLFPSEEDMGSTVGFSYEGLTPTQHATTQPGVILHYLKSALWPAPLCLDHGWPIATRPSAVIPQALLIALLVLASAWMLRRRPWLAYPGAWFFLILAPTSSFVPIQDQAVEHRMYLPLAAIVTLAVISVHALLPPLLTRLALTPRLARVMPITLLFAVVAALGATTIRRNRDYHSAYTMWTDNAVKRPNNARVHYNLGLVLESEGKVEQAVDAYRRATRIRPHAMAHNNIGIILKNRGMLDEAIAEYREAIRIKPHAEAHYNLALALESRGDLDEAVEEYRKAVAVGPHAEAHNNLGLALAGRGELDEAIEQYRQALRVRPDHATAHFNLAIALTNLGRLDEAVDHHRQALAISPGFADAQHFLGVALERQGKLDEAIDAYRKTLRINPRHRPAREALAEHREPERR